MNKTISEEAGSVRSRGLRWFAVAAGLAAVVGIGGQVAAPAAPAPAGVHLPAAGSEGQPGADSGEGPNPSPPHPRPSGAALDAGLAGTGPA
jgi:hypothetical protein